jgi:NADH-quinone oxidoreductase subunit N
MTSVIILASAGIASMFAGIFRAKNLALPLVLMSCIAALALIMFRYNGGYESLMNNMLLFDTLSHGFSIIMILLAMGVLAISRYYYRENIDHLSDIYALFLFSLIGGILSVSYQNLVMLFIGIEALSIPLYILAGSNRRNLFSNEAGLKYFLMGSFATCFLLLGITFIYGTAYSFDMTQIAEYVQSQPDGLPPMFVIGCVLILGAFIFKISAVPFHFWAPDVYQGAPTVITAFMATVVKVAAFGALLRFLEQTLMTQSGIWQDMITIVAILTLIVGNVLALYQQNFKRMLAYSGIANAGYVLVAICATNALTSEYILYYLAAYGIASLIAFAVYTIVKEQTGVDSIDGLKGLFAHNKFLGITLAISMLSLSGIPPMAGFFGKYAVFSNAIDGGVIWPVIIAVLTSLVGVYYYLRVMAISFTAGEMPKVKLGAGYTVVLLVAAAILLLLGILPDLFTSLIA